MRPHLLDRRVIARAALTLAVTLVLAGCGGAGRDSARRAAGEPGMDRAAYQESLARFEVRVESTRSLAEAGDSRRFEASRDSLVADVNAFIRGHPHAEDDPAFVSILNALSSLDTLTSAAAEGYFAVEEGVTIEETDWPSVDLPSPGGPFFRANDTPFPYLENSRIDFWLSYFTGPGRDRFERALYRMQLHRPTVETILDEMGLPRELICIAFIESGFAMKAVSRARAVGPWQFISGTGRRYGLRSNWWYEERSDIVASTYAAGNYLKDLHAIWEDWFLAFAAYNCGEYRVARQVARQKTKSFWELDLPLQTERYVPKFLAALYIMREPEKYGFLIPQVEPLNYDLVAVEHAVEIDVFARCAGTTAEVIRELNPQLRRGATPPNMEIHLKVPAGAGDSCAANLAALPPQERVSWQEHSVRKGETLSSIAARYDTSVDALRDANNIRRSLIRVGQRLVIPVPGGSRTEATAAASRPAYRTRTSTIDRDALERYAERAAAHASTDGRERVFYTVRRNDTLSEIASTHRVSVAQIRSWNNLSRRRHIYPGQKLALYVHGSSGRTESAPPAATAQMDESRFERLEHVVSSGETFYSISRRYNVPMNDLMAWNGRTRSMIRPGDVLVIWRLRAVDETGGR